LRPPLPGPALKNSLREGDIYLAFGGHLSEKLLALIGREQGASLTELRQASGWLAHSVRGFISTAGKKHNVKIASAKNENGDRVYNILA
jgi:hypothetical protein